MALRKGEDIIKKFSGISYIQGLKKGDRHNKNSIKECYESIEKVVRNFDSIYPNLPNFRKFNRVVIDERNVQSFFWLCCNVYWLRSYSTPRICICRLSFVGGKDRIVMEDEDFLSPYLSNHPCCAGLVPFITLTSTFEFSDIIFKHWVWSHCRTRPHTSSNRLRILPTHTRRRFRNLFSSLSTKRHACYAKKITTSKTEFPGYSSTVGILSALSACSTSSCKSHFIQKQESSVSDVFEAR